MVVALLGANVPACMARQNASVEKSIMTFMDRYTNWSHAANDFLKLADSDDDFACFNMKCLAWLYVYCCVVNFIYHAIGKLLYIILCLVTAFSCMLISAGKRYPRVRINATSMVVACTGQFAQRLILMQQTAARSSRSRRGREERKESAMWVL